LMGTRRRFIEAGPMNYRFVVHSDPRHGNPGDLSGPRDGTVRASKDKSRMISPYVNT
jgi:hypothetical protein